MADSSVPVTPGVGASIDTATQANGDHRQVMVLGDASGSQTTAVGANQDLRVSLTNPTAAAAGIFASINAYGGLRVSVEPTPVFFDPFDGALDTTNRWTVAGTSPTVSGGTTSVNAGTVASATSRLTSQPTFSSPGLGFEILATVVQVEASPVANVYRFWGFASEPATPAYQGAAAATSTAVTDAVGFELDTAGNLYCVVYSAGTNTFRSAAVPTATWRDGAPHRYAIFKRSDVIFWYVEGQDAPVASISYRPPSTQTLGIKYSALNNSTAPVAYTFALSAVGVQDSTSQNQTLSDPTFPWRRAAVSSTGALSVNLASSQGAMAAVTGTLSAAGAATGTGVVSTTGQVVVPVAAAGNVTISANTAAFSGALSFEASDDNGTTWYAVTATREDGSGADQAISVTTTLSRMWTTAVPGFTHLRVRVTAFTSGTVAVRLTPGPFLIETSPSLAGSSAVIGTTRGLVEGQNRTLFTAHCAGAALSATETLATLQPYRAATVGTSATSFAVTAGRTLRLQSLTVALVGSATATASALTARLRYANGAAVSATGSAIADEVTVNLAAVASNRVGGTVTFGTQGLELPSGYQFGVSVIGIASGAYDAIVQGYEFI